VKYALAAGQNALARFSNIEAIKHFTYVLQTITSLKEYTNERKVALECLGDAYYANSMFEEAIKTFDQLVKSEEGAIRLRAYRKEMGAVWYRENDSARLLQLVKKAEKHVASDRLERARVLWNRGRALVRSRNLESGLKDHEKALQIFEEEYSLPDIAQLLAGTGITRIMWGVHPEKGMSEIQRSIALYRELCDIRGEITATLLGNSALQLFGLVKGHGDRYANVLEMAEKIGDFENLVEASLQVGLSYEFRGRFEEAIDQSLKSLEYSNKTDAKGTQSRVYAALTMQYAKLGDLKNADHYFDILKKLPTEILLHHRNYYFVIIAEAVMFVVKGQLKEANQCFKKAFELLKTRFYNYFNYTLFWKFNYAWALDMQGRTEQAKSQHANIQKTLLDAEESFAHTDLKANLMMQRKVMVGENLEMRLDMVNIATRPKLIIKVKNVIPSDGFKVSGLPSYCCLQNSGIEMERRQIGAFQVETIKLSVQVTKAGVFSLSPQVEYLDNLGVTKICTPKPIKITVKPLLSAPKEKNVIELVPAKLEFKSESTQKAFEFLVNAFIEDYVRRKLPKERSGWRTLMDIVKQAQVSQYSMYGSGGHRGLATEELEKLGAVEVRFFFGERGRGGKILKLRVACEKENVKMYIDQRI